MLSELSRRQRPNNPVDERRSGKVPTAFGRSDMAIHFNHTILSAHDSKASAIFPGRVVEPPSPEGRSRFAVAGGGLASMDPMSRLEVVTREIDRVWRCAS